MTSQKIRQNFLNFFKEKGHAIVPSSPVVPHHDPSLLFINAGMNQFKDVFLGKSLRDYKTATSSQKCIRVGGKHNDLENVGHTSRHLTFFEMLGNFSFGDYFKKEAIAFAWDVTLHVFEYDPNRVWATILHNDDESFELWKAYLPQERIIRMSEKDNFWAMGETGPCGPCSELLYDRGSSYGPARSPAEDITGERYLEFWNLVFMQFNRNLAGNLEPLPKPCVDTGAGLERVVSLKLGVNSVFETDIFKALIQQIEKISGVPYSIQHESAPAFHVIADHLRSLSFAIADGVTPSNVERGYILRKILRRAVRYGRSLGMDQPFLSHIFPTLIEMMGEDYPLLRAAESRIKEILTLEEENFLRTLRRGGNILNTIIATAEKQNKLISGDDAFKLKDTYGLPLEEILLIAKDSGLTLDIQRYEELEKEAKERSRQSRKTIDQSLSENIYANLLDECGESHFVGYEQNASSTVITAIIKDQKEVLSLNEGETGVLILEKTPFYAEKGGQVGDKGTISTPNAHFQVTDCQSPFTDIIAHHGLLKEGELKVGDTVTASIDQDRRQKIANNHTATHLLHWALNHVLGEHVKQAGSVVDSHRLRFDFNHHKALSEQEIEHIEKLVNQKIRQNTTVRTYELTLDEATKRKEIKQFFGDKYGLHVRVVDVEDSKELCGGTHTQATGHIGFFKIIKEGSIAAGTRRIEAVTGEEAEAIVSTHEKLLLALESVLKVNDQQLIDRIQKLLDENKSLSQTITQLQQQQLLNQTEEILKQKQFIGSLPVLAYETQLESKELKDLAEAIMKQVPSLLLILLSNTHEKSSLVIRLSADLVSQGFHASHLIKVLTPVMQGKGGGKADTAQAGGLPTDAQVLFEIAFKWVEEACTKSS